MALGDGVVESFRRPHTALLLAGEAAKFRSMFDGLREHAVAAHGATAIDLEWDTPLGDAFKASASPAPLMAPCAMLLLLPCATAADAAAWAQTCEADDKKICITQCVALVKPDRPAALTEAESAAIDFGAVEVTAATVLGAWHNHVVALRDNALTHEVEGWWRRAVWACGRQVESWPLQGGGAGVIEGVIQVPRWRGLNSTFGCAVTMDRIAIDVALRDVLTASPTPRVFLPDAVYVFPRSGALTASSSASAPEAMLSHAPSSVHFLVGLEGSPQTPSAQQLCFVKGTRACVHPSAHTMRLTAMTALHPAATPPRCDVNTVAGTTLPPPLPWLAQAAVPHVEMGLAGAAAPSRVVKGYVIGDLILLGETPAWCPDIAPLEGVASATAEDGAIDSGWCRPTRGQSGHAPPLAFEALELGAHPDLWQLFPSRQAATVFRSVDVDFTSFIARRTASAIRDAVDLVRRAVKLDLFGVDLVLFLAGGCVDAAGGTTPPEVVAAIVDVNLLPGYKGVPKPELRDAILAHARSTRSE